MQLHACAASCYEFQQKLLLKLQQKLVFFMGYVVNRLNCLYRFLVFRVNPFWIHVCYFTLLSVACFLFLKAMGWRDPTYSTPNAFDLFFMAVSSATIASNSTVEMEVFSDTQLLVITIFMLLGGEVFTSMIDLQLAKTRYYDSLDRHHSTESGEIELGPMSTDVDGELMVAKSAGDQIQYLRYNCVRYLTMAVLAYFLAVQLVGILSILAYVTVVPSARRVLEKKGLDRQVFSVFTAVSAFANCGFVPTNENMVVFRRNSGLLLTIIPLVLLGNTLFPPCLRLLIWVLRRTSPRAEFDYMLQKPEEIGYYHLLRPLHCLYLVPTVAGFLVVQFTLFTVMEWDSEGLRGMTPFQKLVGALFQSANTRHGGQWVVDLSKLAPAVLFLSVVMMYLPPYTSFSPIVEDERGSTELGMVQRLLLSQLSYLFICTVLICITENEKISEDPVNFNVFNIIVEVVSAYANVGFSTGYSCKRQLKPNRYCKDAWYGFVGRWSKKEDNNLPGATDCNKYNTFSREDNNLLASADDGPKVAI
ncbi:hypothetical protein H6P81_009253 [Aristolochia fimbriata]|uniref:Uncharacterized protein n=1 Tax=Aristolochia fimbriata TaxID=158543 RepID=A0AAV7EKD3_ARIFI|nr:hypothetical protein H6P81_009253 [Aristolochia fimbriata]